MAVSPAKRDRRGEEAEEEAHAGPSSAIKRVKRERVEQLRREEDGDGEDGADESARSGHPAAGRNGNASESDEEDEGLVAERLRKLEYPDDEANLKAYAAFRARRGDVQNSGPAEAGVIKSVTLVNFMNHRHLTIDFNPKMNFMVGHNGSGKSAVLTAISVGLGGKAAMTGRGSGLKDLIRKGCDKAVITITLLNGGINAYKRDVFNPHIVIERTLNSNGSSTYKFRATRDGKTLASKREELVHILEHFYITVDSPLTFLTQDAARSFLQSVDPAKLYQFFLDGTGMLGLALQYEKVGINVGVLAKAKQSIEESLVDKDAKVKYYASKVRQSRRLVELQAKADRLYNELAWALVNEKDQDLENAGKKVDYEQRRLGEIAKRFEQSQARCRPLDDDVNSLQKELEEFDRSRQPTELAKAKAKKRFQSGNLILTEQKGTLKEIADSIRDKKRELEQIGARLRAKQAALTEAEDPEQVALRKDVERHENLLRKLQRELPLKEAAAREKEDDLSKAEQEVEIIRGQWSEIQETVNRLENTMRNLEHQSTNRTSAFGSNLDLVFREISRAHWVHSPPLGPLGLHVQLEDKNYQGIISSQLGQILCSFAVRSSQDKVTMMNILLHCYQRGYRPGYPSQGPPPVIQHSGDLFDFSSGDMSRFGDTVLSKLIIDNPEVLRLLIVQRNIERTFVSPTIQSANQMIDQLHQSGVQNPSIVTADLFNTSGTRQSRQSIAVEQWRGNPLFAKDVQGEIRSLRAQLETQHKLRDKVREQLSKATEAKNEATMGMSVARRKVDELRHGIPSSQFKINELRDRLEDRNDNDLEGLELSRQDAERELAHLEENLTNVAKDIDDSKNVLQKLQDEVDHHDSKLETFAAERGRKQSALEEVVMSRTQLQNNVNHWASSKASAEGRLADAKADYDHAKLQVDEWTEKASGICAERVQTTRTANDIKRERTRIEQSISDAEKSGRVSLEDFMPQYNAALKQVEEDRAKAKQLGIFIDTLNAAVKKRRIRWSEIRAHFAVRVRILFIDYIHRRGFNGRLEFSHDQQQIRIVVRPQGDEGAEGAPRTQLPRNLSGGERSFSTVSLLLSMWGVVQSPIRCLDEWDVFLDHVNRALAAKMLIDGARASGGNQFVLITPQDMSGITVSGPDTKITRMGDPERGQLTLN